MTTRYDLSQVQVTFGGQPVRMPPDVFTYDRDPGPHFHYLTHNMGLSGLFPGPVVDGGRRAWDWNPNCRRTAAQRWFAALDDQDWDQIETGPVTWPHNWDAFRPPFCQCGPPCPGQTKSRRCALCHLGLQDCAPECDERGHRYVCVHSRKRMRGKAAFYWRTPNWVAKPRTRVYRRPLAERIERRRKHWGQVKARR